MKKLLVTILLTFISTSAMAEWTLINGNENITLYADVKSKRKLGNKVKMWTLFDLKAPDSYEGKQILSFVSLDEYDCVNETSRLLSVSFYSENMQKGSMINTTNYAVGQNSHKPITPNTMEESAWLKACGKK